MKLKSLHILSFGGLRDRVFDLSDGVTVVRGDNESGKSSLAMFIKFIFYGLSPRAGKNGASERQRYVNRETGQAAGYLIAEDADGVSYRIERAILPTDGGVLRDRVRIINQKTGESILGQNPGERFFGVPEEVFTSSCFVSQSAGRPRLTPEGSGMSGVRGAMENLLTSADENVNIRRAEAQLDALRRELSHKNGGGGEINELKEKRGALIAERNSAAEKTSETLSLSVSLDDIKRRIAELEAEKARCENIFDALDQIVIKRRIDAAADAEGKLERVGKSLAEWEESPFGGRFDEQIGDAEREIRAYDEERAAFRERFPTDTTEITIPASPRPYPFHAEDAGKPDGKIKDDAIPADGPIPAAAIMRPDGELPEGMDPFEDTGTLRQADPLESDDDLPDGAEAVEEVRRTAAAARSQLLVGVLLSLLGLGGLAVSFLFYKNGYGSYFIPLAVAFVCAILGVILMLRHGKTVGALHQLLSEWNAESAAEIEIAVAEKLNVLRRQKALTRERDRLTAQLEASRIRREAAEERVLSLAGEASLPTDDLYEVLRLLREKNAEALSEKDRLLTRRSNLEGRLEVLREQLADVDVAAAELNAYTVLQTDVGREANALGAEEIKDLLRRREFARSALQSAEKRRSALEEKLAGIGRIDRTPDELTSLIDDTDRRIEELTLRRDALELASDAIRRAGEEMRADVIPRLSRAASERVRATTENYDRLLLDAGLNCSLGADTDVLGEDYFSRGTADMAYLSLRLALTDEVFREERPPLILDESFAHMDAPRAAAFLGTLADEDRQTIVLTCREDEASAARTLGYSVLQME